VPVGIGLLVVIPAVAKQRYRERGIRLALVASRGRSSRQVLAEGLILIGIGGSIGLAVAIVGSRLLARLLYQIEPGDPIALGSACMVLLGAGLMASFFPAREATSIDPAETLRCE
jgi:ABC-type antimicrobial peptide transport system permease subunit